MFPLIKILIVDDDPDTRLLTRYILKRHSEQHFEITEAMNGERALSIIMSAGRIPHIILLDLQMPVMNGVSFLEELSQLALSIQPQIFIISSSKDAFNGADESIKKMVSGIFDKPFSKDHLHTILFTLEQSLSH